METSLNQQSKISNFLPSSAKPPTSPFSSPCAACKVLRRRCASKCVLAPYFPPTELLKFMVAHRVFGASNIIKLLKVLYSQTLQIHTQNPPAHSHAQTPPDNSGGRKQKNKKQKKPLYFFNHNPEHQNVQ